MMTFLTLFSISMAPLSSFSSSFFLKLNLIIFFSLFALFPSSHVILAAAAGCYKSIFSFGDSLADTGNRLYSLGDTASPLGRFPYGETYFNRPTGRSCDGRLVVDFIDDCREFLSKSLFLVGEIGGNDYNHPFFDRRSLAEIQTFVPKVIDAISSAISILIEQGAVTLVVPGNLPIGCASIYLTYYKSSNNDDYNAHTGCLNWLNKFSKYHNKLLQEELDRLRVLHPHANIIYADYYNAAMLFYRSPNKLGFMRGALSACCGGGGPYNYNSTAKCGNADSELCNDHS